MKGDGKSEFGIIPFAIADIFAHIENTTSREFLLRCSYMEIYNEVIADLLVREARTEPQGYSRYRRALTARRHRQLAAVFSVAVGERRYGGRGCGWDDLWRRSGLG